MKSVFKLLLMAVAYLTIFILGAASGAGIEKVKKDAGQNTALHPKTNSKFILCTV